MGLTPDVVAGALIQSAWGNEIRNRSLQVFANAAERTAQWTDAPNGSHCLTADKGRMWVRVGGAWHALGGLIAETRITVPPTAAYDYLTVNFTLPVPRAIAFRHHAQYNGGASTFGIDCDLDGSTIGRFEYPVTGIRMVNGEVFRSTVAAGAHTAIVHTIRTVGADGTYAAMNATPTQPGYLAVFDMGGPP